MVTGISFADVLRLIFATGCLARAQITHPNPHFYFTHTMFLMGQKHKRLIIQKNDKYTFSSFQLLTWHQKRRTSKSTDN